MYQYLVAAVAFAFVGVGFFTVAAGVNCIVDAWSRRKYTQRDTDHYQRTGQL